MKENAAEITSIASLEKKRKLQDSQLEMPLAKQVCREKVEGDESAKGGVESEPESTDSNSFHSKSAVSFSDDEEKTDGGFQETRSSDEPSTSSASWAGTSSGASLYSSENMSSVNSSTREPELLSMNQDQDCSGDQCGRQDVEFVCEVHAEIQPYTDKELEDLLFSDGVARGGSFILSSGRWSADQGAGAKQEGKKKLTIDKEFEQFFSMLML